MEVIMKKLIALILLLWTLTTLCMLPSCSQTSSQTSSSSNEQLIALKATGVKTDFRSFQIAFESVANKDIYNADDKITYLIVEINDDLWSSPITIEDNNIIKTTAQDPWKNEYHGMYLEDPDNPEQFAIIMFCNGNNETCESSASFVNGELIINANQNDDYIIATIYNKNFDERVKTITQGLTLS